MFFIPVDARGAHVMVCDEACLDAVRDGLPLEGTLPLSTSVVCATCYACGLTAEGTHCPCARLEVSCSRPSWLLSAQPRMALDAIYEAAGPTILSDADWEQLQSFAEEVWNGGLVGLMWVRDHQPDPGR
ncbi:hypothetical protein SAMN05660748_2900 [Blastococcus aggregatus]|uniref:Uncharacterized protein n=1 Tax=Blastococcus aggregatus TaxID=38502 RepID=A0A285V7W7_9ACTN|nr:hypothetical protein [Blastococcus aggregatus]SOC50160.1 hypothetical protein SAMN05660748_2900 [Blastococcus aggregatus]